MKKIVLFVLLGMIFLSCDKSENPTKDSKSDKMLSSYDESEVATKRWHKSITKEEVISAQKTWGDAIVAIGEAYSNHGDYEELAEETVEELYAYDKGLVLFKPTKAVEEQFRLIEDEAVSYFVGGIIAEDHGFAIQPWSKVRFENAGIIIKRGWGIAMGNYYFTDANTNEEVKAEFTLGFIKGENGKLLINVHHSSFPYNPGH